MSKSPVSRVLTGMESAEQASRTVAQSWDSGLNVCPYFSLPLAVAAKFSPVFSVREVLVTTLGRESERQPAKGVRVEQGGSCMASSHGL